MATATGIPFTDRLQIAQRSPNTCGAGVYQMGVWNSERLRQAGDGSEEMEETMYRARFARSQGWGRGRIERNGELTAHAAGVIHIQSIDSVPSNKPEFNAALRARQTNGKGGRLLHVVACLRQGNAFASDESDRSPTATFTRLEKQTEMGRENKARIGLRGGLGGLASRGIEIGDHHCRLRERLGFRLEHKGTTSLPESRPPSSVAYLGRDPPTLAKRLQRQRTRHVKGHQRCSCNPRIQKG